jgi:hypothetical protein
VPDAVHVPAWTDQVVDDVSGASFFSFKGAIIEKRVVPIVS